MKKKTIQIFILMLFLLVSTLIYAENWQTVSARAAGMGGTGVAIATGFAQQYYNPALLAIQSKNNNDVMLNVNAELNTTEKVLTLIDKVNKMSDKYNSIISKIKNREYATAVEMMS